MPTANEISAELVPKALAGDQQALAALYANIAPWIDIRIRHAKVPRCDREDLHREIEALIWRMLPQWDPQRSAFSSWLRFAIGTSIRTYYRAQRRWTVDDRLRPNGSSPDDRDGGDPLSSMPRSAQARSQPRPEQAYEDSETLARLLRTLDHEAASIVIDVHLHGMTLAQAGQKRGVGYWVIKRRLNAAMALLRETAAELGIAA